MFRKKKFSSLRYYNVRSYRLACVGERINIIDACQVGGLWKNVECFGYSATVSANACYYHFALACGYIIGIVNGIVFIICQSGIAIGASAILIDVIIVTCTILLGILVGKLLNMDNDLALLTATGSAICGAAAVLGAEPVVKSEPHKTAVAVSTVVIFGTFIPFFTEPEYSTSHPSKWDSTQALPYTK